MALLKLIHLLDICGGRSNTVTLGTADESHPMELLSVTTHSPHTTQNLHQINALRKPLVYDVLLRSIPATTISCTGSIWMCAHMTAMSECIHSVHTVAASLAPAAELLSYCAELHWSAPACMIVLGCFKQRTTRRTAGSH